MADRLTAADLQLLRGSNFGHFVTLRADGSPHSAPVWIDADGDRVLVNTAAGRVKDRNVRRDPRVAISIHDQIDPYRWISISGSVVERTTEGADAHIDALNRRYHDGEPWQPVPGQERVILRIEPDRIVRSRG